MKESEIKDFEQLLENLEKQGWHPMVCDTPVPFYDNDVMCGVPNSVGDVVKEFLAWSIDASTDASSMPSWLSSPSTL